MRVLAKARHDNWRGVSRNYASLEDYSIVPSISEGERHLEFNYLGGDGISRVISIYCIVFDEYFEGVPTRFILLFILCFSKDKDNNKWKSIYQEKVNNNNIKNPYNEWNTDERSGLFFKQPILATPHNDHASDLHKHNYEIINSY